MSAERDRELVRRLLSVPKHEWQVDNHARRETSYYANMGSSTIILEHTLDDNHVCLYEFKSTNCHGAYRSSSYQGGSYPWTDPPVAVLKQYLEEIGLKPKPIRIIP